MPDKAKAHFIDPMLLLKTEKLPEGADVLYEIKLDGYRSIAFKIGGKVHLPSRNDNDFASRYPSIAKALQAMPDETVIDGEVVALDADGKPSFNLSFAIIPSARNRLTWRWMEDEQSGHMPAFLCLSFDSFDSC